MLVFSYDLISYQNDPSEQIQTFCQSDNLQIIFLISTTESQYLIKIAENWDSLEIRDSLI